MTVCIFKWGYSKIS